MKIQDVYIFVSSTFLDMVNERNMMMFEVYPVIKNWGKKYGLDIRLVDLRWGITEKQAKELHHTIKLCLEKVNAADPIFVSFLGRRYGWTPSSEDFNSRLIGKDVDEYLSKGTSATELEILQALDNRFFDGKKKECLFFIRDDERIGMPEELKSVFSDDNEDKALELHKRIKEAYPESTFSYYGFFDEKSTITYKEGVSYHPIKYFKNGDRALVDLLIEQIETLIKKNYSLVEKEATEITSNEYLINKYSKSLPVPTIDDALESIIQNVEYRVQGLFLNDGNGKTSAISRFILRHQDLDLTIRFIKYSRISTDYIGLCKSVAEELKERYGIKEEIEDRYDAYVDFINETVAKYHNDKKSVLIIDGIDDGVSTYAEWRLMLDCLMFDKVIFTCSHVHESYIRSSDVVINSIKKEEIIDVINFILKNDAKMLASELVDLIAERSQGSLAKALYIVFYLRKFSIHEELVATIEDLSNKKLLEVLSEVYIKMMDVQSNINLPGMFDSVLIYLAINDSGINIDFLKRYLKFVYYEISPEISNQYPQIDKDKLISDAVEFVKNYAEEFIYEDSNRLYITDYWLKDLVFMSLKESSGVFGLSKIFDMMVSTYLVDIEDEYYLDVVPADFLNIYRQISYFNLNNDGMPFEMFLQPVFLYKCLKLFGVRNSKKLYQAVIQNYRQNPIPRVIFTEDRDYAERSQKADLDFKQLIRFFGDTLYAQTYKFISRIKAENLVDLKTFLAEYIEFANDWKDNEIIKTFYAKAFKLLTEDKHEYH